MWWPSWVPLVRVVHVRDPSPEEEPEAVEGEESAAQHDDYTALFLTWTVCVCVTEESAVDAASWDNSRTHWSTSLLLIYRQVRQNAVRLETRDARLMT